MKAWDMLKGWQNGERVRGVGGKVEEKWASGQQGPAPEGPTGSGLNPPNLLKHKVWFTVATRGFVGL